MGKAGLGPRIMWTPACGLKARRETWGDAGETPPTVGAGDFAHLAVAEPADPDSPGLLAWNKDPGNPATGDIPSFPDSVWKSEVGGYYNM